MQVIDADERTRQYVKDKYGVTLGKALSPTPPPYHHPPHQVGHDFFRPTKVSGAEMSCSTVLWSAVQCKPPSRFSSAPRPPLCLFKTERFDTLPPWVLGRQVYGDAGYEEDGDLGFYHRKPDSKKQFLEFMGQCLSFECAHDLRVVPCYCMPAACLTRACFSDRGHHTQPDTRVSVSVPRRRAGEWNDTHSPFGDRRRLNLRYHLADDTVEIFELMPRNAGRDFSRVLRRQRLALVLPDRDANERVPSAGKGAAARAWFLLSIVPAAHLSSADHAIRNNACLSCCGVPMCAPPGASAGHRADCPAARRPYSAAPATRTSPITGETTVTPVAAASSLRRPSTSGARLGLEKESHESGRLLTYTDLVCGARIPVYGKWLLIRRCDRHTRAFFHKVRSARC
jgi:hypothetical protein